MLYDWYPQWKREIKTQVDTEEKRTKTQGEVSYLQANERDSEKKPFC